MAGYSGTPLIRKLGLKTGSAYLVNPPDHYFDLVFPIPNSVCFKTSLHGKFDFIHLFAMTVSELTASLSKARDHLVQNGQIWVSWPKKTSGLNSELDENIIRQHGLSIGLVDVKVCAIDEIWSGLKFVIPIKSRR